MKNAQRLTALIALTLIAVAANTATATQGVSPGEIDRLAQVNNSCPTFSWQGVPEAAQYEIVAYSLHTDEDSAEAELAAEAEVLYSQVPAGATSWTPSADQCFAPGGRYVWFVRSVTEAVEDQVIEAGEWSAGRYFSLPAGPSAEEVARAVEVLKQWEATNGGGSLMLSSGTNSGSGTGTGSGHRKGKGEGEGGGEGHRKSVQTASAAIRGENPETDIEAYGVVGSSASVWGAGVAAVNTEGGADLVLDGSFDGMPDTRLSEWGIDRSDPTDQVFAVANNGGGAITFDVYGTLRGTDLECPMCVDSTDIADGAVGATEVEFESIGEAHLADESVTNAKLAVGAVDAVQLSANSVDSSKIIDGAVTMADLADESVGPDQIEFGGVGSDEISSGAVGNGHLAANAVTTEKIADGTITDRDLANDSVTTDHIADLAVNHMKISDSAITNRHFGHGAVDSAAILNGTITAADLDDHEGLYVDSPLNSGLHVVNASTYGVKIESSGSNGILVDQPGEMGLQVMNAAGRAVSVHSSGGHGVYGMTTSADPAHVGGWFENQSVDGIGLYARGGYGRDTAVDLVLGGRINFGDNGTISSSPSMEDSDIVLLSYDNVHIHLDDNDTHSNSEFKIYAGDGSVLFEVSEGGTKSSGASSGVLVDVGGDDPVVVYAVHSPQNWIEDFGSAYLGEGESWVALDEAYSRVVSLDEPYHVFLTPLGDCPLYVARKTAQGFTVRSFGEKHCDVEFDYRIVALRRGYETRRMERYVDRGDD